MLLSKGPIKGLLWKRNVLVLGMCFVNMTSCPSVYWFNIFYFVGRWKALILFIRGFSWLTPPGTLCLRTHREPLRSPGSGPSLANPLGPSPMNSSTVVNCRDLGVAYGSHTESSRRPGAVSGPVNSFIPQNTPQELQGRGRTP